MKHRAFLFFGLVFVLSASITAPLQAQVCPQDLACDGYVGSLGVGTDNPFAQLHVVGAAPGPGTGVMSSGAGVQIIGGDTSFLTELHVGDLIIARGQVRIIQSITTNISLTIDSPFSPTLLGDPFMFQQPITRLADNANATHFMINSLGNVGIGTQTPVHKLDIAAPNVQVGIRSTNAPGGDEALIRFTNATNPETRLAGGELFVGVESNAGGRLLTGGTPNSGGIGASRNLHLGGGQTAHMTITPSGNVGIGTTSPGADLTVDKDRNGGGVSIAAHNTNRNGYATIGVGAPILGGSSAGFAITKYGDQWPGTTPGGDPIGGSTGFEAGGASTRFFFNPGPSGIYSFDIGSSEKVRINSSEMDVTVPVYAPAFRMLSDMRLKEFITPLTGTLDKLDKIRGVSFKWSKQAEALGQSRDHQDVGVIAQEVQAVFPELVTARDPENYQAVDYSKLTVVLLEAVKELKTENEALKRRIEALESK